MDTLEILAFQKIMESVMYSSSVGKSSLWLFGNVCLSILFSATVLFFAVLNYRQRKISGVAQKYPAKIFEKAVNSRAAEFVRFYVAKYSFYVEFVIIAVFFAFLTHISIFAALFIVGLYAAFRLFLFKKMRVFFKRSEGSVVAIGVYALFFLLFFLLIAVFNIMPALIEVSAEINAQQRMQEMFLEDFE